MSSAGGIRSYRKPGINGGLYVTPHLLLCPIGFKGYRIAALAGRSVRVHELVLLAFVGPRPPGMECRHLDGDPSNNRRDNLAWGTPKENQADSARHGTKAIGSRKGTSKITELDAVHIRQLCAAGLTRVEVGRMYGLASGSVTALVQHRTWRHVA